MKRHVLYAFAFTMIATLSIACKKGEGSKSSGSSSGAKLCEIEFENQKQFSAAKMAGTYQGKTGEGKAVKLVLTATDALNAQLSIDGKQLVVSKLTYSCTMFMLNVTTDAGDFSASPMTVGDKMVLRFTPPTGNSFSLTRN